MFEMGVLIELAEEIVAETGLLEMIGNSGVEASSGITTAAQSASGKLDAIFDPRIRKAFFLTEETGQALRAKKGKK